MGLAVGGGFDRKLLGLDLSEIPKFARKGVLLKNQVFHKTRTSYLEWGQVHPIPLHRTTTGLPTENPDPSGALKSMTSCLKVRKKSAPSTLQQLSGQCLGFWTWQKGVVGGCWSW